MKRILTVLLSLTIILSLFSACGNGLKSSKNAFIGQWYNDRGNSLYISSDGTYKSELEDEYGTWKTLDKKTIEFTDSYGKTSEAKIESTELDGDYLDWGVNGIYHRGIINIENEASDTSDIHIGAAINYTLKGSYSFSDDRAAIEYEDTIGRSYAALIDTDGRILYKLENGRVMEDHGFSGIACFGSTISDNYYIVNKNGELVATSQDLGFDEVLTYGDGMALVYKEESDANGYQYYYGVIDENGNWKQELQKWEKSYSKISYVGCGIFEFGDELRSGSLYSYGDLNSILYNAVTGKRSMSIEEHYSSNIQFVDNVAYCRTLHINTDNGDSEFTELKYVSINTNFEITELGYDFGYVSGKYLITRNDDKRIMITDPQTGMTAEPKGYESNQINRIVFEEDHAYVIIVGNDDNYYFTVIDQNGNLMFEPRRYDLEDYYSGSKFRVSFGDGKVAYCSSDNWFIVDAEGNMLAENLPYYKIDSFSNGIACASRSAEMTWSGMYTGTDFCFINSKGEQILQHLYE